MSNALTKPPTSVTAAGQAFNYSVWSPQTVITLAKVPWNADYRDIVKFSNGQVGLDDYIDNLSGPTITAKNATYAKFNVPVNLEIPFNTAINYNYLRAMNPTMPISGDVGRSYYYFINDVQYVNPSTTRFMIQLDVWSSFGYGITFGNCYVEQGHIGIANENQFDDHGRTWLTVPEGLDVGNEYRIAARWERVLAKADANMSYTVMVVANTTLTEDPGTQQAPNLNMADPSQAENLVNGAGIYFFAPNSFINFCNAMRTKPWVMQGIVSITAIPDPAIYGMPMVPATVQGVPCETAEIGELTKVNNPVQMGWRDTINLGRYSNLKKFFTFPYMAVEVTAYTGTPLILKPECWDDDDASVVEIAHFAPPNPRIAFVPHRYNADPAVAESSDGYGINNDGGEWLDQATGVFNFPTFALLTNQYIEFMAANTHGISWQYASADWSQQKALYGNQVSYDQANVGVDTSKNLTQQGIAANTAQMGIANQATVRRGAVGAGSNLLGGAGLALGGNIGGGFNSAVQAASDVADAAISIDAQTQSTGVQNALAAGQNRAVTNQMGYMRDTNKNLADYSAKGDYANTIAGINAKVQDAKLTQPAVSGQVGGDAFNLVASKMGYDVKVKFVSAAVQRNIGEYWLRYGYAINSFTTPPASLMVMEKFTYWRLKESYITSWSCPESLKQAIRGIFEKGVTVWANPADIGNIDLADNNPLPGVTL